MKKDLDVQIRPQAFKRCLTNIIDNALRYGSKVEINVASVNDKEGVVITVDDDGPGIPEEEYQKVKS